MTLTQLLSNSLAAAALVLMTSLGAIANDVPTDNPPVDKASEQTSSSTGSGSSSADEAEVDSAEDLAEFQSLFNEGIANGREISFETEESQATLLTKDQPDWINLSGDESLIQNKAVVASKLYFSADKTERDLDKALRDAVDRYVNWYLDDQKASLLIRHDARYIRKHLMTEQFDEVWDVKQFNTNMHRRHALVEFNDSFRSHLDAEWRDVTQTSKLLTTGLAAFGVLGLLGVAFSYLRLDNATSGAYSGRLKFLSAVAILALAAAGALFANVNADWLRWM